MTIPILWLKLVTQEQTTPEMITMEQFVVAFLQKHRPVAWMTDPYSRAAGGPRVYIHLPSNIKI